jgi:hypothetical protein
MSLLILVFFLDWILIQILEPLFFLDNVILKNNVCNSFIVGVEDVWPVLESKLLRNDRGAMFLLNFGVRRVIVVKSVVFHRLRAPICSDSLRWLKSLCLLIIFLIVREALIL